MGGLRGHRSPAKPSTRYTRVWPNYDTMTHHRAWSEAVAIRMAISSYELRTFFAEQAEVFVGKPTRCTYGAGLSYLSGCQATWPPLDTRRFPLGACSRTNSAMLEGFRGQACPLGQEVSAGDNSGLQHCVSPHIHCARVARFATCAQ